MDRERRLAKEIGENERDSLQCSLERLEEKVKADELSFVENKNYHCSFFISLA
jgi:hypothetical protein